MCYGAILLQEINPRLGSSQGMRNPVIDKFRYNSPGWSRMLHGFTHGFRITFYVYVSC